jgi:membrane protein
VQFVVGLLILSCAFAALMKYLPDGHVGWRDALVGGVISAVLFSVGKKLFALYLTHAGTANAFGAAGSLAVLLMWLYFAAAVLLLGAEAAASRAEQREGKPEPKEAADASHAPAMPAPAREVVHAPVVASVEHREPVVVEPAPLPPRSVRTKAGSSPWAVVVAKGVDTVKANPVRLAIAAAGASLFVFTKGSGRTQRGHRSAKA